MSIPSKYRQKKRVKEFNSLMEELNNLEKRGVLKGKTLVNCMNAFLCGYMFSKKTPDPVLYYAVIRGGDPRPEIEKGIKLIQP